MQILASATALVIAAAAAVPAPVASPTSSLPVIGHTLTARPACVALRDLVSPALQAAMHADAVYAKSRENVRDYMFQKEFGTGAQRRMAIVRLDQQQALIQRDIVTISKSLGDARLSEAQTDPELHALRIALEQLQSAEEAQLDGVYSLTEGAHYADLHNDDRAMQLAKAEAATQSKKSLDLARPIATAEPYNDNGGPPPVPTIGPSSGFSTDAFENSSHRAPDSATPPPAAMAETVAREGIATKTIVALSATCR